MSALGNVSLKELEVELMRRGYQIASRDETAQRMAYDKGFEAGQRAAWQSMSAEELQKFADEIDNIINQKK